jgi:drug/metabolite transporter (DMT)-like permease
MSWVAFALLSTFFLGCYNIAVKRAVHDNAVLPVLLFANVSSALVWLALMGATRFGPASAFVPGVLRTDAINAAQHLQILVKAFLVATIWILVYCGVKKLPVSIAAPIQSTNPLWMLFGAVLVLGERLTALQWLGVAVTLGAFVSLSLVGAREGVHFLRNRAVWLLLCGVMLAAPGGLYDKWLLAHAGFSPATLQAWFSIYLALLFCPLAAGWKLRLWPRNEFTWRWSILLVSVFLLASDFFFFEALRLPDGLLSVVSSIRRGEVLITFAGGVLLFHEKNVRRKLPVIIALLAGIVITMSG